MRAHSENPPGHEARICAVPTQEKPDPEVLTLSIEYVVVKGWASSSVEYLPSMHQALVLSPHTV